MKPDGTVVIDTKLNTNGLEAGSHDAEQEIRRMAQAIQDLSTTSKIALQRQVNQFVKLNSAYAQNEKKLKQLKEEMALYGETKIPTQEYSNAEKEIQKISQALDRAIERQIKFYETGGDIKSRAFAGMEYDIERLNQQLDEANERKKQLVSSGKAFTLGKDTDKYSQMSDRYEKESQKLANTNAILGTTFAKVEDELNKYKERLRGIDNNQKKAQKSGKKFNNELRSTGKNAKKAQYSMGRMLATSILFSTVFRAISMVTAGLKEGMDNLAQYSDDTNQALSLLLSSLTQLKNTFATAFSPLVEVAAPALTQFINLLSQAVTWTAQLLAALTGKDTFVKAVKVQQDYADSLDKTKDETEAAAKETEKAIAPFDQLIQITRQKKDKDKESGELKPEDMFTTEEVSNDIKLQADAIKETLGQLFTPLKQSWEENGPQVLSSVKNMFSAVKQLAGDVSASFMQVWNAEGYGKAITDNLLITFSNLVDTVGNLITNFDKAWVSGDTGTKILRHLGDIILEITGFFRQASESLKEWSADVDFSPLLQSFDRVLIAIKPIVSDVGNALLWFLNSILLPITKWGVEQALPKVFDLIAAALGAVHSVVQALKPLGLWLWEEFLQPLGEWTGALIIAALEKLVEWLTKFSSWINENQVLVENITLAVVTFFAAWKFSEFILGIGQLISSLGGFLGIGEQVISILARTVSSINPVILAVTSIISLIAVLARNWDNMSPSEKVVSSILAAASAVGILAVALGAVAGGVGAGVVAASLAAGIAAATIAINAGKRAAAAGYSGGYSSRNTYPVSAYASIPYKMPMLATGTVVPPRAGMFAAILGDNNRETEVVSPLSTMKQALKEALAESNISGGNQVVKADLVLDSTKFGQLVVKFGNSEKNRVGVRMVTEGGA